MSATPGRQPFKPSWSGIHITHLSLLALQHRNMRNRRIPIPHLLLRQPHLKFLHSLAQRQRELLITRHEQRHRRGLALVLEHLPPLLVPEAKLLIVERPCEIPYFALPWCAGVVCLRGVVVFDVPYQAQDAVGVQDSVNFCESGGGCEPVESLCGT